MRTELPLSHVRVEAGATAEIEIEVTNTTEIIDGVTAIVDGINPEWIRLQRPLLSLFPEASDRLVLYFDIPRTCQAGDYLIDVRIVSAVDPDQESIQDFWLTVAPHVDMEIELRPSMIRGGRKGTTVATVRNTGNCPVDAQVSAEEATREIDCVVDPPDLTVPYAHEMPVEITFRGRRPWFGESVGRQIEIRVRSGETVVEEAATFNQRPRISRGLMTFMTLAAIVALWALIFLFLITWLRGADGPGKAVPDEIATGTDDVELALIRGTVAGTVRAASTAEGIPKVTVEAFRVKRFPAQSERPRLDNCSQPSPPDPDPERQVACSIASGGTDDDGRYQLRTLIPGSYVMRFSAPGYDEVWYPGDLESGDYLKIAPLEPARDQDVQMVGKTGSVEVQIDLPENTDTSELTVSITSKNSAPAGADVAGLARAQIEPACTIDADGLVRCDGLPTPGEYVITVSGPGFETQRIDVGLVGGDDTVVDTVPLLGEPGTIEGRVVDQNGSPLVGAEVTISSGQYRARVFSDRAGVFVVADLPTPGDYVIDLSLAGFTGRTIALELEAGAPRDVGDQELVGGAGSMSGVVVDEQGNRLGGVQITVAGDRATALTTTLTDGDRGSFFIQDLVVPGAYSVAFTAPGLQTETRIVAFDEAGSKSLGEVRMFTAFGRIEGRVVDPTGTAVGNAEIELIDGLRSRTTTSSTTGNGSFGFDDVAPGSYTIVVRSTDDPDNVKMWVAQRDVAAGEVVRLDRVVLPLSSLGTVQGVVTDTDGVELGLVGVTLTGEGKTMNTTTESDPATRGTFSFTGLDVPGTYELRFSLANYGTVTRSVTLSFTGGQFISSLNLEMAPNPGPVTGSVIDSVTGEPIVGADVMLISVAGGDPQNTVTDVDGAFRFDEVPAGLVAISVDYTAPDLSTGTIIGFQYEVPAGGGSLTEPLRLDVIPAPPPTTLPPPPPPPPTTAPPP
jgi:hypothetical protein